MAVISVQPKEAVTSYGGFDNIRRGLSIQPNYITSRIESQSVKSWKLRGWNPITNGYEVWFGDNPLTPPDSGNALDYITAQQLKQR